jgi:hypothetical protein
MRRRTDADAEDSLMLMRTCARTLTRARARRLTGQPDLSSAPVFTPVIRGVITLPPARNQTAEPDIAAGTTSQPRSHRDAISVQSAIIYGLPPDSKNRRPYRGGREILEASGDHAGIGCLDPSETECSPPIEQLGEFAPGAANLPSGGRTSADRSRYDRRAVRDDSRQALKAARKDDSTDL